MQTIEISSFLKWAGGKRWLVNRFSKLLPTEYENYFEPFVGSGAVFFAMLPGRGQISDSNNELVNLYKAIKRDPVSVRRALKRHANLHSDRYYYKVRSSQPISDVGRAARMLYLNRTCWNGLYRVNKLGDFNVPRGTKNTVILGEDNFEAAAAALQKVRIKCCDFEEALDACSADDFAFIDPPYTVSHNNNGFIKYNETLFTWNDQVRLCKAVQRARKRRVKILLTNADHGPIRQMYRSLGKLHVLPRASIISGLNDGRKQTSELAVQINY